MTHSGDKPHNVGDKGQRYEVRYRDSDGSEHVMGWTDRADGGRLAFSLSKHPTWKLSQIVDRGDLVTRGDSAHHTSPDQGA